MGFSVRTAETKPSVHLSHRRITLTARPGSSRVKREAVMHAWHKALLHEAVPELIRRWEPKLGVEVADDHCGVAQPVRCLLQDLVELLRQRGRAGVAAGDLTVLEFELDVVEDGAAVEGFAVELDGAVD